MATEPVVAGCGDCDRCATAGSAWGEPRRHEQSKCNQCRWKRIIALGLTAKEIKGCRRKTNISVYRKQFDEIKEHEAGPEMERTGREVACSCCFRSKMEIGRLAYLFMAHSFITHSKIGWGGWCVRGCGLLRPVLPARRMVHSIECLDVSGPPSPRTTHTQNSIAMQGSVEGGVGCGPKQQPPCWWGLPCICQSVN